MSSDEHDSPHSGEKSGYGGWVWVALACGIVGGGGYIWSQRIPIAHGYIADALKSRGIRATYTLEQIGPRKQRIVDVVIGDARHPDLIAKSIEIDVGYSAFAPGIAAIRASGVKFHGKLRRDGSFSFGDLDKLRSATSSSGSMELPDLHLTLHDTRGLLYSPWGTMGMAIEGSGNPSSNFAAKTALAVRNMSAAGCSTPVMDAILDTRIINGAPKINGPLTAAAIACAGRNIAVSAIRAQLDLRAPAALNHISGRITSQMGAARADGALLAEPSAEISFDGDSRNIVGRFGFGSQLLQYGEARAALGRAEGAWTYKHGGKAGAFSAQGQVNAHDLHLYDSNGLNKIMSSVAGTPIAPLVKKLRSALDAMARKNTLRSAFDLKYTGSKAQGTIHSFNLASSTGGSITMAPDSRLSWSWPDGRWGLNGALTSQGGGLPHMALRLASARNGAIGGQMFVDNYSAESAQIALAPIRFLAGGNGTTKVTTSLTVTGPMDDGYVQGLHIPIKASFAGNEYRFNPGCTQASVDSFRYSSLKLDRWSGALCSTDGRGIVVSGASGTSYGAYLGPLHLDGQLAGAPFRVTGKRAQYASGSGGIALDNVQMLLGKNGETLRLKAGKLNGEAVSSGYVGMLSGLEARIGAVPLLINEGAAKWAYHHGRLELGGSIGVIDTASPDRFNPLTSRDFSLAMAKGKIVASGTLAAKSRGKAFATVRINHDLGHRSGNAILRVSALHFGPELQPDDISRIALGVIANVRGVVNGEGDIRWNRKGVSSTGSFATDNMDFAAAFGPVSGLATKIDFTDLLGLVSKPGQLATIRSANPGVEVVDGRLFYALLPNQQAAIEGGNWPFAGGQLILLPSTMDFSAEKPRHLTFQVIGLEAGAFINTMELDNISATGLFDGLLPMVFDASGGRIVGGLMVARQQGLLPLVLSDTRNLSIPCIPERQSGTLSYVGQVSNENLGKMGKLAFDALKDLQYKCLTIALDGALDGEVVTQVSFNGVNRGELTSVPKMMSRQFTGLPFIFNIKIQAPFRGLINTARSFVDPSLLIRSKMGDQFIPVVENRLAVQPSESDSAATGDRK